MRLAVNVGMTFGPAVGGFLILVDYSILFWVDAAACIAAALVIWYFFHGRSVETSSDETETASSRSPWSDGPYLQFLTGIFLFSLMFFQLETAFGVYITEHYGLAEHHIGLLFSGNTILIILTEMLLLKWIEPFNRWRVLAVGALFSGAGLSLLPLGNSFLFALTAILVFTVGEMLLLPVAYTLASTRASSSTRGAYLGAFGIAFSSAFIIGPPLGTLVYTSLGSDLLWYCCLPIAGIAAVTFWRLRSSTWDTSS
jgi:MFS family permease